MRIVNTLSNYRRRNFELSNIPLRFCKLSPASDNLIDICARSIAKRSLIMLPPPNAACHHSLCEHTVGGAWGSPCANAKLTTFGEFAVNARPSERHHGLEHRDFDELAAAGLFAVIERRRIACESSPQVLSAIRSVRSAAPRSTGPSGRDPAKTLDDVVIGRPAAGDRPREAMDAGVDAGRRAGAGRASFSSFCGGCCARTRRRYR